MLFLQSESQSSDMAKIFLKILQATTLTFMAVGCGNRGFNPPSDDDMLRNFHAHEYAFDEIAKILSNCPYGDTYPPFYPIENVEDSLCIASLGPEKCAHLDSLLAAVGSERVYFRSRHSLWQVEHRDFHSIPPVEELPDTVVAKVTVTYYADGWSIGPSVSKEYVYNQKNDSTGIWDIELNGLIEMLNNDPEVPGGMASKHIKGNWYIELWYDK